MVMGPQILFVTIYQVTKNNQKPQLTIILISTIVCES